MRFGWISAFVPDARGVRWIFGLLLLPAVWLAKGGNTPATLPAPAPVETKAPAAASPAPAAVRVAPAAPRAAR